MEQSVGESCELAYRCELGNCRFPISLDALLTSRALSVHKTLSGV